MLLPWRFALPRWPLEPRNRNRALATWPGWKNARRNWNPPRAKGGSMNGPAPVVAGGMVYVSSGYGTFGLRRGNVLLAFGLP